MNSDLRSLSDVLSQYLQERGLDHIKQEASIPDVWKEVLGDAAARHCTVLRYVNRQLIVQVDSPVWRSELRLRKDELITRLNDRLHVQLVEDIVLR